MSHLTVSFKRLGPNRLHEFMNQDFCLFHLSNLSVINFHFTYSCKRAYWQQKPRTDSEQQPQLAEGSTRSFQLVFVLPAAAPCSSNGSTAGDEEHIYCHFLFCRYVYPPLSAFEGWRLAELLAHRFVLA